MNFDGEGPNNENEVVNFFLREDKAKGSLSWSLVHKLISMSGGYFHYILSLTLTLIGGGSWLVFKVSSVAFGQDYANHKPVKQYIPKFIILSILCLIFAILGSVIILNGFLKLSRKIHAKMTFRLLHA